VIHHGDGGLEPFTRNKDGSCVIESWETEGHVRRQLIFRPVPNGWEMSVCQPGVGIVFLTDHQATQLAYWLRKPAE
jgi:hypothetical protein